MSPEAFMRAIHTSPMHDFPSLVFIIAIIFYSEHKMKY